MTRLRITVSCLMIIIAVIAGDFAVLVLLRGLGSLVLRALPMVDVLAVLLATTALRLRRRGEAPLSHVVFLLAGGMALILFVYLVHLRPDIVYGYLWATTGRQAAENPLVEILRVWLAVSVPILVPALFAGWAARGYRLKLTT